MKTLKKEKEFSVIYNKGRKIHTNYTIVIYMENREKENKYGFVASKKTGNAVKRNRIKRLLKQVVRNHQSEFSHKYNYIFIAKSHLKENIDSLKYNDFEKDILKGIKKI